MPIQADTVSRALFLTLFLNVKFKLYGDKIHDRSASSAGRLHSLSLEYDKCSSGGTVTCIGWVGGVLATYLCCLEARESRALPLGSQTSLSGYTIEHC